MSSESKVEEKKINLLWAVVKNLLENNKFTIADIDFEVISTELKIVNADSAKKRWKRLIRWFEKRDEDEESLPRKAKVVKGKAPAKPKAKGDKQNAKDNEDRKPAKGEKKPKGVSRPKSMTTSLPRRVKKEERQEDITEEVGTDDSSGGEKEIESKKLKGETSTDKPDSGDENFGSEEEGHMDETDGLVSSNPEISVKVGPDSGDEEA